MPKKRNAPSSLAEIIGEGSYVAGVWDATPGLRGINTNNAVTISKDPEWIKTMAGWIGGEARQFTASSGKVYWGWYVPLEIRLQLLDLLEKELEDGGPGTGICATTAQIDSIRGKLDKALNKQLYGKGA